MSASNNCSKKKDEAHIKAGLCCLEKKRYKYNHKIYNHIVSNEKKEQMNNIGLYIMFEIKTNYTYITYFTTTAIKMAACIIVKLSYW